jgi:hypothetical protein
MLLVLGRLAAFRFQGLQANELVIGAIAKGTLEAVPHNAAAVVAQALKPNQGSRDIATQLRFFRSSALHRSVHQQGIGIAIELCALRTASALSA